MESNVPPIYVRIVNIEIHDVNNLLPWWNHNWFEMSFEANRFSILCIHPRKSSGHTPCLGWRYTSQSIFLLRHWMIKRNVTSSRLPVPFITTKLVIILYPTILLFVDSIFLENWISSIHFTVIPIFVVCVWLWIYFSTGI